LAFLKKISITHLNARVFAMKIRHFYVSQIYVVMIISIAFKHPKGYHMSSIEERQIIQS